MITALLLRLAPDSCRCVGCEVVLSGIEEQVSRANQHKEQQLGLKQQIESEVSWQGRQLLPRGPVVQCRGVWAVAVADRQGGWGLSDSRTFLVIPYSFHPGRSPTLKKPLKLQQQRQPQPHPRTLSNT